MGSHNVLNTFISVEIGAKRMLLLFSILCFKMVWDNLMFFDWVMSPESTTKLFPRLSSIQFWCISSGSLVYPIGRGRGWYFGESVQKRVKFRSLPRSLEEVNQ